jgi:poly(A) polymerase
VAEALGKDVPVKYFKNFGTAMLRSGELQIEFVGHGKNRIRRIPESRLWKMEPLKKIRTGGISPLMRWLLTWIRRTSERSGDPLMEFRILMKKIIRTPLDPDITFSDDPLRMMRAIRFACQLVLYH